VNLPYLTASTAPIPGRIRVNIEDFVVDEIAAYSPDGTGSHLFVRFEKRDFTTNEAVKRLARVLEVAPRDVGTAGTKDRRAVTTQWASFPGVDPARALAVELEGIRVLEAIPHGSKLRTGHLEGNRFSIRLRDVDATRDDDIRRTIDRLTREGMPNYFGEQRFGRDGKNVERAIAWLAGDARPPRDHFERKMLASALQSEFFNRTVAARVEAGELGRIFHGDLCRKEETGGMFTAEDVAVDQPRADAFEISPTGPMFGPEMRWPTHEAAERERALLESSGLGPELLERLGKHAPGTRRVVRIRPRDLTVERDAEGVVLRFALPSGGYATALLRELMKDSEDPARSGGDASESEGR